MNRITPFLALIAIVPQMSVAAPAVKIPTMAVCVQASGNLVVKQKCAKTEQQATLSTISASGATGAAGSKGDKGDQGPIGIQGPAGTKGDKGDQGLSGAKGDKGDQGLPGAKGDKGDQGTAGAQGPQGGSGTFNLNKCLKRSSNIGGANTVSVEGACLVSEFVLTWGVYTDSFGTSIESVSVIPGSNSLLSNKDMPGIVKADVRGPDASTVFNVRLDVYCCQP